MEEAFDIEKPKVVPNLTEEEYEKMRSAPRGKSKGDQIVQIEIPMAIAKVKLYFEIYDISTGGWGYWHFS